MSYSECPPKQIWVIHIVRTHRMDKKHNCIRLCAVIWNGPVRGIVCCASTAHDWSIWTCGADQWHLHSPKRDRLVSALPAVCLVHFFFLSQGPYHISTLNKMFLQCYSDSKSFYILFSHWFKKKKKSFSDRLDTEPEILATSSSLLKGIFFYVNNLTSYYGATQKTSVVCLMIVVSLVMMHCTNLSCLKSFLRTRRGWK